MEPSMTDVQNFINAIREANPETTVFTRKALLDFADAQGVKHNVVWGVIKSVPAVKRGVYDLAATVTQLHPVQAVPAIVLSEEGTYVPKRVKTYVKWGHFRDIATIIESKMFYPVYLTGLSGNGKTMMVEQACADLNREYIRVQITPETDEDDLIGGFRLVNGETIFSKGPVIKAMEAGAILLVDEIDRGSNKLMALQGVLEGKPVLIKKTGELVTPAPGFNVIATSNTKGKGSEDGRFIAATIIDEAFLERFTITMEQPYPTASIEKKIVVKHMELFGQVDDDFAENLTKWSAAIRKTFDEGGIDEVISTRRLCHIAQTFAIFKDRKKSIDLCVSRFDEDTRAAFVDLYTKIDASASKANTSGQTAKADDKEDYRDDAPF
jgi:MoxR-like ATPase